MGSRKIILYIAVSIDGYIAGPEDNLDFLSIVESPPEDYGYSNFVSTIDTVVMGRKTYDKVLGFGIEFPHKGRECYVITKTRQGSDEHVKFWNDDPCALIKNIKMKAGKDVFIDGGGVLVNTLMQENLIDRYILSTIPVMLGNGVPLFKPGRPFQKLKLIQSQTFPSGLIQSWYEV